jgi:tetratricopeptide (TPR) repeat protein
MSRGIDPTDIAAIRGAASAGVDIVAIATHAATSAGFGRREAVPMAVSFGLAAGQRASQLFDDQAVVDMLRAAIPLWHSLPEDERARHAVSAAEIELGQALRRLGDDRQAAAAYQAAIATARDDIELARAYSAASWLPYEHGRFEQSDEILKQGLARVTDPLAIATLQSSRGWVLGRLGRFEDAEPLLRQSIAVLEKRGPSAALMRALDRLSMAVPSIDAEERIRLLERALVLSTEIGEVRERATFQMHLASVLRQAGQADRALEEITRARASARLTGERYIESVCEWTAAEIQASRGEFEDAIGHRRGELLILAEIGGNAQHEAKAHAHISYLSRLVGDDSTASSEAATALLIASHSGNAELTAEIETLLSGTGWSTTVSESLGRARGNTAGTAQGQPARHGQ